MTSEHKVPSWVDTMQRGLFKDEVTKKLGSQHDLHSSWLSSWKPKDAKAKVHFSYMKKNGDEIVAKSKAFEINDQSKKKCIVCNKMFMSPAWVCYAYKYKDGITKEKIYDSKNLACIFHFYCRGVFNERKPTYDYVYEESDDIDESEFLAYDEF